MKTLNIENYTYVGYDGQPRKAEKLYGKKILTAPPGYVFTGAFVNTLNSDTYILGIHEPEVFKTGKDFCHTVQYRFEVKPEPKPEPKLNSEKVEKEGKSYLFRFIRNGSPDSGEWLKFCNTFLRCADGTGTYSNVDIYERIEI